MRLRLPARLPTRLPACYLCAPPACAATADVTFERVATLLPAVAIVGGSDQEFSVASGIRVQTAIDLATVCPGAQLWLAGLAACGTQHSRSTATPALQAST